MQLRSVMNRVTADNGQLQHGGIQLNSLAVANDRNRVSVALALRHEATWIITLRQRDGGDLLTSPFRYDVTRDAVTTPPHGVGTRHASAPSSSRRGA